MMLVWALSRTTVIPSRFSGPDVLKPLEARTDLRGPPFDPRINLSGLPLISLGTIKPEVRG